MATLYDNACTIAEEQILMEDNINLRLPILGKNNLRLWRASLQAYAEEHGLTQWIETPAPSNIVGDEAVKRKHRAQAYRLITSTLSADTLTRIGEHILELEPRDMLQTIMDAYAADATPAAHEALRARAEQLRIKPRESVDDYVDRHMSLRAEMAQANYPLIENERTTISFIIKGLTARPSFKPHVTMLTLQQPANIRATRTALQMLATSLDAVGAPSSNIPTPSRRTYDTTRRQWCDFHSAFGNHTTPQCRDRQRMMAQQQTMQWPSPSYNPTGYYAHPAPMGYRPRPQGQAVQRPARGRASARARSARRHQQQAQTVAVPPDLSPEVIYEEGDGQWPQGEDDNKDHQFESYVVDSACYPSFTPRRSLTAKPVHSTVTLADGTRCAIIAEQYERLTTPNGKTLHLPTLSTAPTFTEPLLSVREVTTANQCAIVLTSRGGCVARRVQIHPANIIAPIDTHEAGYVMKLRRAESGQPRARTAARKTKMQSQSRITRYFQQRKTVARRPLPAVRQSHQRAPPMVVSRRPLPRVRNKRTDRVTHRLMSPHYLPSIPDLLKEAAVDAYTWHLIMNHTGLRTLSLMARHVPASGLPPSMRAESVPMHCSGCARGKMSRAPYVHHARSTPPGHTIMLDLIGPLASEQHVFKFALICVEMHSRMAAVYLLRSKSDAEQYMIEHLTKVARHYGRPVGRLRCDNANELLTKMIIRCCGQSATQIDPTCPHSPQQNAIAERINRTFLSRVRATLTAVDLPFAKYWPWCLLDTCGKYNSTLHSATNAIPRQQWEQARIATSPFKQRTLSLTLFRVFGELGYIPVNKAPKKKQEDRAVLARYLFVVDDDHYQIMLPETGRLLKCRVVNFQPHNPSFDPVHSIRRTMPVTEHTKARINQHHSIPRTAMSANLRPFHQHKPPPMRSAAPPPLPQPVRTPPRTVREARRSLESTCWRRAYEKELRTLQSFNSLLPVSVHHIPRGAVVRAPVVTFTYKLDRMGRVNGYKARLSFPGHVLQPGWHFDPDRLSVYAASREAVRLLFSIAAHLSMDIFHIDLTSAFLHETYEGPPIYMQVPKDFDGNPTYQAAAVRVVGNIYGLQSAPRRYAEGLSTHLTALGYVPMKHDSNIYTRTTHLGRLLMAVTTDDFTVATSSYRMYRQLLGHLRLKYCAKDLGRPNFMLGWCFNQDLHTKAIHIAQPHLVDAYVTILDTGQPRLRASTTPYSAGLQLHKATQHEPVVRRTEYQRAVGILRYLVDSSRPDLAVAVNDLARAMQHPTQRHWLAATQVARYLKGTRNYALHFTRGSAKIRAQADAAFAPAHTQRRSVAGYLVYHGHNLIAWSTRTIKTIVISTCEAEYIASSNAARHTHWLAKLLTETTGETLSPIPLDMDNQGALAVAKKNGHTKRSKYIDVRHHLLQQLAQRRIIQPGFVRSRDLTADIMTKALKSHAYITHREQLQVMPQSGSRNSGTAAVGGHESAGNQDHVGGMIGRV